MNIVLFSSNEEIKTLFLSQFMFMGINLYPINDFDKLFSVTAKEDIHCVILDMDEKKVDWIHVIKSLRERSARNAVCFIMINNGHDHLYLSKLIMEGIKTFFSREEMNEGAVKKLGEKLLSQHKENEKRRFVRVIPQKDDKVHVNLEIKGAANYGYFKGELLDLSAIGAAVCFNNKEPLSLMKGNSPDINTLQIVINNRIYFCEGKVMRKGDNVAVIKFEKPSDFFKIGISSYIARKVIF